MSNQDPFLLGPEERPRTEYCRLIGGHVPPQLADYLTLLSIYYGTTMSGMIRYMIQYWKDNGESQDFMVEALAARAYKEWTRRLKENQGQSKWATRNKVIQRFREYEDEIRQWLQRRKISDSVITAVIQEIEALYGMSGGSVNEA